MLAKPRKVVSTKYTIGLEDKIVLDILAKDMNMEAGETLRELLGKIVGVLDVDYNGHFGNYIYIEVDVDHDISATWNLIYTLIVNYL